MGPQAILRVQFLGEIVAKELGKISNQDEAHESEKC